MRNSFKISVLYRKRFSFSKEIISRTIILVFFILVGCMPNVVMVNSAYHPYLAKSLCGFSIRGKVGGIVSVSIVLDEDNNLELNRDQIKERDIYFDHNSEYFFSMQSMREKNFQDRIPCRKQIIRIRYRLLDQEKVLDLQFNGQKNQNFVIKEKKDGVLYE
ncbi:hypothetical protein [Leptospira vanthielii]|uniref:Lipoprotein n=1 Tax=Leptospira vanthielii TaxID=293085 RepID=A0ABY2NJI5_9LEPT|nr:hypothetical protein [Leptospira vanthielii]TGM45993.1 hypothetical protein EHQ95_17565 [Leptospira vanthielii]